MGIFSIAYVLFVVGYHLPDVGTSPMHAKAQGSLDAMVVPPCAKPGRGIRRIDGGKFGLQFDVPTREVEVLGGKWDVDYVRFVIKPKTGDGYLEAWFGPYAFNSKPDQELRVKSVTINKRDIVDASGKEVGADNSGKLESSEFWRHAFIAMGGAEGARYKTHRENVELFDRIINSACFIPYPNR